MNKLTNKSKKQTQKHVHINWGRDGLKQKNYKQSYNGSTINEKDKFDSLNQNFKILCDKRHAKTVKRKINQEKILAEYIIDKELIFKTYNFHKYIRKRQQDRKNS